MSEADAGAHFRNIEPHIQHVIVVTGKHILMAKHNNIIDPPLGDLTEQHPILLETLLFSGAILFIPEVWILRPVLSIFGFGPSGPVKGSYLYVLRLFFICLTFLSRYIRCLGATPFLGCNCCKR
jgi:hypothetical protein